MSLWFLFLFLYNFLQIFVFLTVWCYFLSVIFRLIVFLIVKRYPQHGQAVAVCVSVLLSGSLLFELLHLYSDITSSRSPDFSSLWISLYSTSCHRGNLNWFGPIWRLNPLYVVAHLIEEIIVAVFGMFGRSVGEYVAGLFHDQPWLLGFLSLLLTYLVVVASILVFATFHLRIGFSGITLSRSAVGEGNIRSRLHLNNSMKACSGHVDN